MKKYFISNFIKVSIFAFFAIMLLASKASASTTVDGLNYSITGSTATITGYSGLGNSVTIPSTIKEGGTDYVVTTISESAFLGKYYLTEIAIPNSVTTIGDNAFSYCGMLKNITIPESVNDIGESVFNNCISLTNINVDPYNESYSSIDGVLFNKSIHTLISYPGGKEGSYTIPDGVTSIDTNSFYGSINLTSLTIPNSVTTIGESAFNQCYNLKNINIPNSITTINKSTFNSCVSLTSISIPSSVINIEEDAFIYCNGLVSINVDPENAYYSSSDGVLFNKLATTILIFPPGKGDTYSIPNSVTSIGSGAFFNCNNLRSITIPNSVINIGDKAFAECYFLTNLSIPNSVTSIGNYAFHYCNGLTNITLPQNLKYLGEGAFNGCNGLTTITIPDSLSSISKQAFWACNNLSNVTIGKNVTNIDSEAFSSCYNLSEIKFLGNAPTLGDNVFPLYNLNFTLYYLANKTGFTDNWNGYTTIKTGIEITTLPSKVKYITGESLDLTSLVVKGYFKDGTTANISNSTLSVSGFNSSTPTKGQVITLLANGGSASFTIDIIPKTYTVSFNPNGGGTVSSQTVISGEKAIKPSPPTKAGYVFQGWYKDNNLINPFDFSTPILSNTTLYAKWVQIPLAPVTVTATPSEYNNIKITWSMVSGSTGYEVYKYASNTSTYSTLVYTGTSSSFINTGLIAGNAYYYKVRAYTIVGTTKIYGNYSVMVNSKPIPSVPASFSASSAGYNEIKLTWNVVTGAAGYEVYKYSSSAATYGTLVYNGASSSFINTGLLTGTTHYYKIRSYTMVGTTKVYGNFSAIVSSKPIPSIPASFSASSASYNGIKISWAAVTGASGYEVYRDISSTGTFNTIVYSGTSLSFINAGLTTGTTYYYKVRVYTLIGITKVYSNYSTIINTKPVPSIPTNFKVVRVNSTSLNLTWNGVSGASGYDVERLTLGSGTYSFVKTTPYLYFTNVNLTPGKTYYYRIKAYRIVGTTKVYGPYTNAVYSTP